MPQPKPITENTIDFALNTALSFIARNSCSEFYWLNLSHVFLWMWTQSKMLLFQFQNYNYRNTLYLWITYSELSEHILKHLAQYETVNRPQLHVFLLYVQWSLFVNKADSLILSAQVLVQFTNILEVIKDYECIQCRNIYIYLIRRFSV